MDLSFDALKSDYTTRLAAMQPTRWADALDVAKGLLKNRDRFVTLQLSTQVPALWVIPVFQREEPSFDTYLGNGDPLNRPTVDEPKGRGPFASWEDGAIDALQYDKIIDVTQWSWEMACYMWEKWNGFGPRRWHHAPSGYLWSGTDQYKGGKYTSDGTWTASTWDHQLGVVILAKAIVQLDPEIGGGFSGSIAS